MEEGKRGRRMRWGGGGGVRRAVVSVEWHTKIRMFVMVIII